MASPISANVHSEHPGTMWGGLVKTVKPLLLGLTQAVGSAIGAARLPIGLIPRRPLLCLKMLRQRRAPGADFSPDLEGRDRLRFMLVDDLPFGPSEMRGYGRYPGQKVGGVMCHTMLLSAQSMRKICATGLPLLLLKARKCLGFSVAGW
ncbi:hypothetical protein [Sphingobium sp. TomMM35A]